MNFQYPVLASGGEGGGAVSCNHSRTTISSVRRGEAQIIAWASVDVGVYGFSSSRSLAVGEGGVSVFRALYRMSIKPCVWKDI